MENMLKEMQMHMEMDVLAKFAIVFGPTITHIEKQKKQFSPADVRKVVSASIKIYAIFSGFVPLEEMELLLTKDLAAVGVDPVPIMNEITAYLAKLKAEAKTE